MLDTSISAVKMPLLALKGLVVFPKTVASFDVVRKKSVNAINAAMNGNRLLLLVTQKDFYTEEPVLSDIYNIGCVVRIKQVLKVSDSLLKVLVEGVCRAKYENFYNGKNYYTADVFECADKPITNREIYKETLLRRIKIQFRKYASIMPNMASDVLATVESANDLGYISDFIAFNIPAPFDDKQYILEQLSIVNRAKILCELLAKEREIGEIDRKISDKTKTLIDNNQREYYLREQIRAISNELYGDDSADEINNYYAKVDSLKAEDTVKKVLLSHVAKLAKMPQGSHEGSVERAYLDTCLQLPWNKFSSTVVDIKRAAKILDRDIYGMKKVKERILELLSVYTLAPDIKGQIICLVGPPGVGKTSIGKTVAECMGRKFVRFSLGGIHDEAEIRGHRKTYIGAMPGKIINAIKKAGIGNPLILLDEIDKLGSDYKGDPSSALLEVLDPEQNNTFVDNYIEIPYDLSRTVFLATANSIDTIPVPLRDRMEIINLSGYTRNEKFNIAKKHLVSKQIQRHGIKKTQLKFADSALYNIIDFYTREAGVRNLEKNIAALCRKSVKLIASGEASRITLKDSDVEKMLGKHKYKAQIILDNDEVGIINGLAWTAVGGEIMQLEIASMKGTGKIELTGSLGDVMKESAMAAVSYVRANAEQYDIDPDFYKNTDIHIHATEAAIKKDGPSAGVTITTGLISALTNTPIPRDIAMTGEVTIRGRVLAIGGLKEKSMAAYAGGVKKIFIPKDNLSDLEEVDDIVKENVTFIPVSNVNEIITQTIIRDNFNNYEDWVMKSHLLSDNKNQTMRQ